ncbi:MAG: DNA repair protein RecN [Anaerolineae bacterium]|nr:DNA repair protein RecN [Anaerolineae bacterium]MDW8101381.1 DNA repair protein RecN [Anaerolineae bacterium]
MLSEITIRNFAIIDELRLRLRAGFNIFTGETGAGKSIIIDAISTLLGGRATSDVIRSGTEEAYIEGVFILDEAHVSLIKPTLEEYGLEITDNILIISREIREGRSICRVNGRTVPAGVLSQITPYLIDIHGQSEHLALLSPARQRDFLDRYGGLEELRNKVAEKVKRLREVRALLEKLRRDEREIARRIDQLEYQVQEITSANLKSGEDEELAQERRRLLNAEKLQSLADEVYSALYEGAEGENSALDQMARALNALQGLGKIEPEMEKLYKALEEAMAWTEEIAHRIRDYRDRIEFSPERLQQVEERLQLINSLKRKYGDTIEEILEYAEAARRELAEISTNQERIEELAREEEKLLHEIGALACELSLRRREAAASLAEGVEKHLAELGMAKARFQVSITWKEDPDGVWVDNKRYAFDSTGIDRVEFLVSTNPGEPLKPLAKVASGGETSRLMLALKTVLSAADDTPTLIFDEIDAGIGGRMGAVVGEKMWRLSEHHQVLCVTHLPQLAAYGDAHFRVEKVEINQRTVTRVKELERRARIEELALMLGSSTPLAYQSAEEMLRQVEAFKSSFQTT